MYYKTMAGEKVSVLGMGNMRLPTIGGDPKAAIDYDKAKEIIDYAYSHGINYYDTAYRYHAGESELFIGKALAEYPRESYFLASKLPGHMMEKKAGGKIGFTGLLAGNPDTTIPELFERQLEKCQVEYFDFYLLHNLCESSYDFYTDPELDVVNYLIEQKKAGKIRHLAFSSHGRTDTIDKFLAKYEGVFDFVQIQLNYLDWKLQDAKGKYDVITKHGASVVVMEPVRGGRLVTLPDAGEKLLKAAKPEDSNAKWAFRFLQALPGVSVVLSGMTTMEQIVENVETFAEPNPVNAEEQAILQKVADMMLDLVPCTGCAYCTDGCPKNINIPKLISIYNEEKNGGSMFRFNKAADEEGLDPAECIGCGGCAALCPQSIDIPDVMAKLAEILAAK